MPNRILREGILSSRRVDRLSLEAELFFRRLMSVVDDYGRFSADPQQLRAACYPLRLDFVNGGHLRRWLAECEGADLLKLYEVDGEPYLELLRFKQQLRAQRSKFPEPPSNAQHVLSTCQACAKRMRPESESGAERESELEAGAEGELEGGSRPPATLGPLRGPTRTAPSPREEPSDPPGTVPASESECELFLDAYPKRPSDRVREAVQDEWQQLSSEERQAALSAVAVYAKQPVRDLRSLPNADKWLKFHVVVPMRRRVS